MENAVDALKMAAAVLIFVLALSICINAFGEARITTETILNYKDRELDYTYVDYNSEDTQRTVGLETIIPSIYKAYKENYKIVFEFRDATEGLYQKKQEDGTYKNICYIDLENETLGSEEQKNNFIKAIIYGRTFISNPDNLENALKIKLNDNGLYNKYKDIEFKEYSGVYYREETAGATKEPDVNKTVKRVITYTEKE